MSDTFKTDKSLLSLAFHPSRGDKPDVMKWREVRGGGVREVRVLCYSLSRGVSGEPSVEGGYYLSKNLASWRGRHCFRQREQVARAQSVRRSRQAVKWEIREGGDAGSIVSWGQLWRVRLESQGSTQPMQDFDPSTDLNGLGSQLSQSYSLCPN